MPKRPKEITDENVLSVDVNSIAVDRRFPDLLFSNSKKKLPKIQKWISEAEELNQGDLLINNDRNLIRNFRNQLKEHLNNLLTFENRTTEQNSKQEHDDIESRVDAFYNQVYNQLPMRILPFLKEETEKKTVDLKVLEERQKAAARAEEEYKKLSQQMQEKIKEWEEKKKELESVPGEVAATRFGKYFEIQANKYQDEAKKWDKQRKRFFWVLLTLIASNFVAFIFVPEDVFSIRYGIAKVALLSILSYGMAFASRNYHIKENLAVANRHRKNIADTLNEFLATKPESADRSHIIKVASEEMFKNIHSGHIKSSDESLNSPVYEFINKVSPFNDKS